MYKYDTCTTISLSRSNPEPVLAVTPMVSRNLPPSFFNANYHVKGMYSSSDLYSDYSTSLHHLAAHGATPDPWQYAQVNILTVPVQCYSCIFPFS